MTKYALKPKESSVGEDVDKLPNMVKICAVDTPIYCLHPMLGELYYADYYEF